MLSEKTAVITGGSRGIGKEIALTFAKNGADIAIIYSGNDEAANEVCIEAKENGIKAKAYKCNVADFEAVKIVCTTIKTDFSKVDILVNNAGITRDNLLLRMSECDFDDVINVNLKGAFNFTKHLSKYLMKSEAGRIINISSVSGMMGNAGQANYSAAKAGLIGFTKTVAKELSSKKITCNAIAPGFIATDMTANLPQAVADNISNMVPLKRMGNPSDIANLATFLASANAEYITGEIIKVDGGLYI